MSGQLVGEILDARAGHLADLSQAQTLALVAIAEKCHADSRQGSVRLAHIQAAIGRSQRTAVRALEQLKDRGLIRVVKRGYKSHGVARANVYELAVVAPQDGACATQDGVSTRPVDSPVDTPPKMAQAIDGACATQDGVSTADVLAPNPDVLAPNPDVLTPPIGGAHDGSLDGEDDGGTCARRASPTVRPNQFRNDPPEDQSNIEDKPPTLAAANAAPPDLMALPLPPIHWPQDYPNPEPPVRCPKHAHHEGWVQEPCPPCGEANNAHKAWEANRAQWRQARANATQAWIAACDHCDEAGWAQDDPDDQLPALKCLHAPNWQAWWKLHPGGAAPRRSDATEQRRAS